MRKWICILMFCVFGCKPPTSLDGTYTWKNDARGVTYYFQSDSTFSTYGWSNNSRDTGTGVYRIINDSIYFTYGKLSFTGESNVVADTVKTDRDSCRLQISVFDNHGVMMRSGIRIQMVHQWMSTGNIYGYYDLYVERGNFPLTVNCSWGKYDPVEIHIKDPADCNLVFHMELTDAAAISAGSCVGMKFKKRGRRIQFTYQGALNGGGKETTRQKLIRMK